MLAYYVEFHMRKALAPMLFAFLCEPIDHPVGSPF
jgi:hypothetical protein